MSSRRIARLREFSKTFAVVDDGIGKALRDRERCGLLVVSQFGQLQPVTVSKWVLLSRHLLAHRTLYNEPVERFAFNDA
jgi:hypothetical protein